MKSRTRNLLTALVGSTALLALASSPSFARVNMPTPLNYDMGPWGQWTMGGGISSWAAWWNNNISTNVGGGGSSSGDVSIDNGMVILKKVNSTFTTQIWVGVPPQTPVMGWNTPLLGPNLRAFGKPGNPYGHQSALFKGFLTWNITDWLSLDGGRLPSPDGTEVGVDWFNPTPFLSDLNNMQTTVADGFQVDLTAPWDWANGSALSIRLADGYKVGNMNELGFVGLWNLNPDGSNWLTAFGHTRFGPVCGNASTAPNIGDCGFVGGPGIVNADLIGFGALYNFGNLSISPEIEYQWLPKDTFGSGPDAPKTTYSNWAMQVTADYAINDNWSLTGQLMYVTQHGDSTDPNNCAYGNFLGLDQCGTNGNVGSGQGTFGAGANLLGIQAGPTYQYGNMYIRPFIAWSHISNFYKGTGLGSPGNGYGQDGSKADQVVLLLNLGWMIGQ